jgi:glyoxylase-like metal-dependent hydrolase (beta-lactamase superfamily II)
VVLLDINFEYNNEIRNINPVVLMDDIEVVLVDCGYPGFLPLLENEMKSKGINPASLTKVIITHHDDDHMGALYEIKKKYPNIQVVASEIESEHISGRRKSLRLIQAEDVLKTLPEEQKKIGLEFINILKKIKPVNVDLFVNDGEEFNWAGGVRIIATPGHTPGHISLLLKESNSIVTGDAAVVENKKLVVANPNYSLDLKKAEMSLEKIIAMKPDRYYCYHGGEYHEKDSKIPNDDNNTCFSGSL